MSATIVIDPGSDPVAGSRLFASSFVDTAFTLSNQSDVGVLGWKWEWLDTPYISPTLEPPPAPSFDSTLSVTPDVVGWSILIRLTTYSDVARTVVDGVATEVLGIKFDEPLDWCLPAAGEKGQIDATRGWMRGVNRILADLRAGGGGGGGSRGAAYWADTSEDDGAYNAAFPVIYDVDFTATIDRISFWDGTASADFTVTAPAAGVGDHNRVFGLLETSGGTGAGGKAKISLVPQGSTAFISAGSSVEDTLGIKLVLRGPGTLHLFQYDEALDKWRAVGGAGSLGGAELLHLTGRLGDQGAFAEVELVDLVTDNVGVDSPPGFGPARVIYLSAVAAYNAVTGFDATDALDDCFVPCKFIVNGGLPVVLKMANSGSLSENQMFGGAGVMQYVLRPSQIAIIWWTRDGWFFFPVGDSGSKQRIRTSEDVTDVSDGEIVDFEIFSTTPVLTVPEPVYPGQRFGCRILYGDPTVDVYLTVDPSGTFLIENPLTGVHDTVPFKLYYPNGTFIWEVSESLTWVVRRSEAGSVVLGSRQLYPFGALDTALYLAQSYEIPSVALLNYRVDLGLNARVVLSAAHTLKFFTTRGGDGLLPGQPLRGTITISQDGTGGRTITSWKTDSDEAIYQGGGGAPALSSAPNAIDLVDWYWDGVRLFVYPPRLNWS